MAISSSSGSNSIDDSSSSPSSTLSASSLDSTPESREPTPEYDPIAAYEALTPLHWDAEEFDFGIASEDDEPMGGKPFRFLGSSEEHSEEESGGGGGWSDDAEIDGGNSTFDGASDDDDDNDDSDGGDAPARSPKRRRY